MNAVRVPRRRRIWRWLLISAGALIVIGAVGSWSINWLCYARPPKVDEFPAIVNETVKTENGRRRIGQCWMERRDGLIAMYLAGDPFTRGYANVKLTQDLLDEQETEFVQSIREHVPSTVKLWLLSKLVLLRNRNLADFVRMEDQLELYGEAEACIDKYPQFGPLYNRFLNYHAAHDIAHAVMDSSLIGCTSFAAWDDATADGHLLVARNFDFDAARCFDRNKTVSLVAPEHGRKYITVSWPGMIGVLSGINDARIGVFIHAAASDDKRMVGTPVALVVRDMLQNAGSLQEAIDIVAGSVVSVADIYFITDGKTGQAVTVEKTPLRWAVRRVEGNHMICSNHFLTEQLKDDPGNIRYRAQGTSLDRHRRMDQLVSASLGELDRTEAATILRDTFVTGVAAGGLGNNSAVNPLGATHAVIVDATDGVIWVSRWPHQLGAFVPFSIESFEQGTAHGEIIPEDALLTSGGYQRYLDAQGKLKQAEALARKKKWQEARQAAEAAGKLNPGYYRTFMILGEIEIGQGNWQAAQSFLRQAQALHVAYGDERAEIERLLATVAQKQGRTTTRRE